MAFRPVSVRTVISVLSLLPLSTSRAQLGPPCVADSPERRGGIGCTIIESKVLPVDLKPPVFWHIDRFDTPEAARNSVGPTSVAFEGAGRTWLLSIEADTGTHHGGHHVAHVGPLKLSHAGRYALQVQVAAFTPGMFSVVHHHSGVEAIYVVEGEACYETASRAFRLRKGGTLAIDAGVLHRAVVPGSTLRYVIAVIVHDASQPPTTRMADHMQTQLVSCR